MTAKRGECSLCVAGGPWEAVGWAVEQLERGWFPALLPSNPESHHYEPLRVDQFIEALLATMELTRGRRYLEVGCGIGTKLMIASRMGFEVTGIDNFEPYVATARHLCPEAKIEVADAKGYSVRGYDVIYSYLPFLPGPEAAFEARIAEEADRGSIIVAPLAHLDLYGWAALDRHRSVWGRN